MERCSRNTVIMMMMMMMMIIIIFMIMMMMMMMMIMSFRTEMMFYMIACIWVFNKHNFQLFPSCLKPSLKHIL